MSRMPALDRSYEHGRKADYLNRELRVVQQETEHRLEARLTFPFSMSKERKDAIQMNRSENIDPEKLVSLMESRDFVEKMSGLFLLRYTKAGQLGDGAYIVIEQSIREIINYDIVQEDDLKLMILEQLPGCFNRLDKDKAISIISNLLSGSKNEQEVAVAILCQLEGPEKNILIEQIVNQAGAETKSNLAYSLREAGKEAIPVLERLCSDSDGDVRANAVSSLGKMGQSALVALRRVAADSMNPETKEAADMAIEDIADRFTDQDETDTPGTKNQAAKTQDTETFKKWLLRNQKTLFATPHTKELAEELTHIEQICTELETEFPDDFVGVVIFGGTEKGYYKPGSDLDFKLIAKTRRVYDRFVSKVSEFVPTDAVESKKFVDAESLSPAHPDADILFRGIFIGDRDTLLELQAEVTKKSDDKQWDRIRSEVILYETVLGKLKMRANLPVQEATKIENATMIMKAPPTREQAVKLLERRITKK